MENPDKESGVFEEGTADPQGAQAPTSDEAGTDVPAPAGADSDQVAADADAASDDAASSEESEDEQTPAGESIADLKGQVAQLSDDLAHARADMYNLQREYSGYVRRTKTQAASHRSDGQREVVESLLGVLDDIDAARAAGDLSGPFAAIAAKLEQSLTSGYGLERYGEAGDPFDPALHDALMAQTASDVEVPTVAQVLQPGYRMGDKVLRPTKVLVHNPE
ncbi:MAG: nucleotide exchange factor GrpE [Actinomycetaceae bacterium]|nr:nucleotide exchange factor GrpE [Actinomycetaceae bacterium]MDU0969822.1 nucleotide exchange factor GrpE [Actinomycetaceae bacterium]